MSRVRGTSLPTAVVVVVDTILINVGFALAWWARYELQVGPDVAAENYVTLDAYQYIQVALTFVLLVVFKLQGLYNDRPGVNWIDQVGILMSGAAVGIAIMIIAVFYYRPYAFSRLIFLYVWLGIVVLLALARLLDRNFRAYLRKRGIGLVRLLVVGAGPLGLVIMRNIVAQPDLGYDVIGFVDGERDEDIGRFKALGGLGGLSRVLRDQKVEEVIIALPSASHQKIVEIMMQCERHRVFFRLVPDFYELSLSQVDISEINGIPLIGVREASLQGWNLLLKRVMDVIVSAGVLVFLSPLIALIGLSIKLDSPGPTLFAQTRVGRGGRTFTCYKFRSMKVGAEDQITRLSTLNEADGPIFKMRNDPRLTRVGKLLRRLSLDELPQFYNILLGDMSLVGPRPPIPYEVDRYEDWHRKRLDVSPGLTGMWQVSGRSELTFDEMVLLDIWYIENWSLGLDLKIMFRTIPAVLLAKGAY
ncbi:MAG: sugar transferase [Chloroflexi bacterium]|nr:sugar transferase [Chloroflexota bacterium]